MKFWKSLALSVFALIGIGLFQNCGKKNFSDGATAASTSETQASSSTANVVDSGTSATALDPNQTYSITCTSQANKTQTLMGKVGSAANTLVAMAPSGEGYWAINVAKGQITSAYNCISDQSLAGGSPADNYGVPTCMSNAKSGRVCSKWGLCSYVQGAANQFQSCTYQ